MDRLGSIGLIVAFLGISLVAGCGSSTQPSVEASTTESAAVQKTPPAPQCVAGYTGSLVKETEQVSLGATAPVSARVMRMLRMTPSPDVGRLPLPPRTSDLPGKLPAAVEEYWRDGSESFLASANSEDAETAKILDSSDGEYSWAIYQIPGIDSNTQILRLRVQASAPAFSGEDPGYWVGIADYERDCWRTIARTENLDYQRSFSLTEPYRSPGDSVYVFVLVLENQGVTVDRVGLEVDRPTWLEVTVDEGPDTGWTPTIAFVQNGNPLVVYSDFSTRQLMMAVGDRVSGLGDPSNWSLSPVDTLVDPRLSEGAVATWADMVVSPVTDLPRVSYCYVNLTGDTEAQNSVPAFGVLTGGLAGGSWLNYSIWKGDGQDEPSVDGAGYSSIDVHPLTGFYGHAIHARNEYSQPERPEYDMEYRVFDLDDNNVANPPAVHLTRNFGANWRFPHLRYQPEDGNGTVCINGGYVYYEEAAENWIEIYVQAQSTSLGSCAYDPVDGLLGSSFVFVLPGGERLNYVGYDESLLGTTVEVDAIPVTMAGEWIGGSNQLAYAPDGSPAIAYSLYDGSAIHANYAYWDGGAWVIESVSAEPSTPDDPAVLVLLDLAFDGDGIPAVCYNHIEGVNSSLRFAIRGT